MTKLSRKEELKVSPIMTESTSENKVSVVSFGG